MNKKGFYQEITKRLNGFSKKEIDDIIEYYDELINEKMDNNYTEEEAIISFGDVDDILRNIKTEVVMKRSNETKSNTLRNFFIILGVCSSPILIPLGIGFFFVFFAILITLVSVLFSFAISSGGIFISGLYVTVEMIISKADPSVIFIFFGGMLLASSLLCLLTIFVYKISKHILNLITHLFSKLVKNKMNKKEIQNV